MGKRERRKDMEQKWILVEERPPEERDGRGAGRIYCSQRILL